MSGRIIERSLSVWPECMHAWIESLGPVEEILDIFIKNEVAVEKVDDWQSWSPIMKRTITVFHDSKWCTQSFIFKGGVWYLV